MKYKEQKIKKSGEYDLEHCICIDEGALPAQSTDAGRIKFINSSEAF